MLARFRMIRGARSAGDPLPDGIRQDTRKHTRHCLRPTPELVSGFLDEPTDGNWRTFEEAYSRLIESRFAEDRASYHLSTTQDDVEALMGTPEDELERVFLDEDKGRQLMHATYGSVLIKGRGADGRPYRERLMEILAKHEDLHMEFVTRHFDKHLGLLKVTG